MEFALLAIAVLLLAPLAVYTHLRIPRHTASGGQAIFTQAVLAMMGMAFGAITSFLYATDGPGALLIFLIGFGVVHFPAACILFLKQARQTQRPAPRMRGGFRK